MSHLFPRFVIMDKAVKSGLLSLTVEEVEDAFLVSRKNGFLIDCSHTQLPECWDPFEKIATQLTEHVANKTIRQQIEKLHGDNKIPENRLERIVLHKILTFLTSGYIWQDGEETVPKKLPRCLAVPLTRVSDALGMKPILSYPSMILGNWQMKDATRSFDFENLKAMYKTPGGAGADWFILTHVIIEQRFAPAIEAILDAMRYSTEGTENDEALAKALGVIPDVMKNMNKTFNDIKEGVKPNQFYDELRIFYTGWGGGRGPLPDGLIYQGVYEDKPTPMKGGSAAQSTTLQLLDAALGITHEGEQKKFLDEVRDYMLKEHRDFCASVWKDSNIRHYVMRCNNKDVRKVYNDCITAILKFRTLHKFQVT
ncbi:indoleamine 2,3-dioxygenase 1-like, partial [Mizuhopecten yessoensis]|uniref:indoleamine 2,3-dioxygenase 1-like n=1 Tax=Mizuhopecten yessoensis TaxID=6573 RepID=UPI000B45BB94